MFAFCNKIPLNQVVALFVFCKKRSTNQVARAQASSGFILRASSRIREMRLSLLDGVVTFYNNIPFCLDYCSWNELSKPPSYGETCRNVTLSFRSAQSAAPLLQKWACVTRRVGKDDCGATTTDHNWQMLRKRLISAKVTQTALSFREFLFLKYNYKRQNMIQSSFEILPHLKDHQHYTINILKMREAFGRRKFEINGVSFSVIRWKTPAEQDIEAWMPSTQTYDLFLMIHCTGP